MLWSKASQPYSDDDLEQLTQETQLRIIES